MYCKLKRIGRRRRLWPILKYYPSFRPDVIRETQNYRIKGNLEKYQSNERNIEELSD